MKAGALFIYITAAHSDEGTRIARALVEERLAACVNVLGEIRSIYHWNGSVQEGAEVALVAKTTRRRFAALRRRVVELHSYDCPCVVALPILDGAPSFLRWIAAETRPVQSSRRLPPSKPARKRK